MDFSEFAVMYRAEGRHWWYRGLRAHLYRQTGLDQPASRAWRILDAGCGTGGTLAALRRTGHAHTWGFDYAAAALYFCRRRGLSHVCRGSITAIPFPDATFDLVISDDVVSDIGTRNEAGALRELYRVLRPGGRLFLNLPAYPFLLSAHDRAVGTARRYTRQTVRPLLTGAGFAIERLAYWNALLFPVVALVRLARKGEAPESGGALRSDIRVPPAPLNRLLSALVRAESRLPTRLAIPFGSSIICLARKPAGR